MVWTCRNIRKSNTYIRVSKRVCGTHETAGAVRGWNSDENCRHLTNFIAHTVLLYLFSFTPNSQSRILLLYCMVWPYEDVYTFIYSHIIRICVYTCVIVYCSWAFIDYSCIDHNCHYCISCLYRWSWENCGIYLVYKLYF